MNKKTSYLFYSFIFLSIMIGSELIYLQTTKSIDEKIKIKKSSFVALIGLSDLAISTEATYIRHRSLSDIFSIYKDDPTLREYFPSTYTISHAKINYEK